MLEFLPLNRRSEEALATAFAERGLGELIKLHRAQASQEAKRELTTALHDDLKDEKPVREMIADLREMAQKHDIPDHEVITIVSIHIYSYSPHPTVRPIRYDDTR